MPGLLRFGSTGLDKSPPAGGGAGGEIKHTVATYNDLPPDVNDTLGRVTTTSAAGIYQVVATVDSETLDMYVPSSVATRGLTYVIDGSGNKARVSTGVGSDTPAIIAARGWVPTVAGAGSSIADSGGDIKYTSAAVAAPNHAFSLFSPVLGLDKDLFWIIEIDAPTFTAGSNRQFGSAVQVLDGAGGINQIYTQNHSGVNSGAWYSSSVAAPQQLGAGDLSLSAFERVFITGVWKPSPDLDDAFLAWAANAGAGLAGESASARYDDFSTSAGDTRILLQCDSQSGVAGDFTVREFHLFEVG